METEVYVTATVDTWAKSATWNVILPNMERTVNNIVSVKLETPDFATRKMAAVIVCLDMWVNCVRTDVKKGSSGPIVRRSVPVEASPSAIM